MMDTYRPETFEGIVGQPTERVADVLDTGAPNILMYGPPGTGKTTTAYVIAREVQGSTAEIMEFNASDDRGIDTVRNDIIPAAGQTTLSGAPRVIFLDEMESMTTEAQQALRQPMEQSDAIFVLACNDVEAVHDAVRSRCHEFHYDALDRSAVRQRVGQLAAAEGVDLAEKRLDGIATFANGDMRAAIQRYQQVARGATDPEAAAPTDGNDLERSAREFLGED